MLDFNWNISSWLNKVLPKERKTTINVSWLNALLSPIQTMADTFATKCLDWDFKIKYNSQQKILEGLLNKLYDSSLRRIRVETIADLAPPVILYHDAEEPTGPVLYFDGESADGPILMHDGEESAYDFRVLVPTSLTSSEAQIKSWINRYKLADKTYIIIYI